MKKINNIILFILFIVALCSCGDDNSKNQDNNDSSKTESGNNSASENSNKEVNDKPDVDPQFKKFLEKFDSKSLPYAENPTGDEKFDKIPLNEQALYLSKAEKLSKKDLEAMADYTDFYYISNPLNTNNFHAIVYGRFEMGSTYYFLCTFNNQGKLISNIDFAAYELMGAGPQAGQEFNTKGSIDKNMEVTVKSDEETRKYKIHDNGKIVRL